MLPKGRIDFGLCEILGVSKCGVASPKASLILNPQSQDSKCVNNAPANPILSTLLSVHPNCCYPSRAPNLAQHCSHQNVGVIKGGGHRQLGLGLIAPGICSQENTTAERSTKSNKERYSKCLLYKKKNASFLMLFWSVFPFGKQPKT